MLAKGLNMLELKERMLRTNLKLLFYNRIQNTWATRHRHTGTDTDIYK